MTDVLNPVTVEAAAAGKKVLDRERSCVTRAPRSDPYTRLRGGRDVPGVCVRVGGGADGAHGLGEPHGCCGGLPELCGVPAVSGSAGGAVRRTGFSKAVRDLIAARSEGVCELMIPLVCTGRGEQAHHRRPRGIGGSRRDDTNLASNGLWLCASCHAYIESHRTEALEKGWLLRQPTRSSAAPADIPVVYRGVTRHLTDLGLLQEVSNG